MSGSHWSHCLCTKKSLNSWCSHYFQYSVHITFDFLRVSEQNALSDFFSSRLHPTNSLIRIHCGYYKYDAEPSGDHPSKYITKLYIRVTLRKVWKTIRTYCNECYVISRGGRYLCIFLPLIVYLVNYICSLQPMVND